MNAFTTSQLAGIAAAIDARDRELRDELEQSGKKRYLDLAGSVHDTGDEAAATELIDMKFGNFPRQFFHRAAIELPAGERVAEQRRLRKFFHLDRVFDRRTGTSDQRTLRRASDSDDFQIEFRCEPAVESQLFLAVMPTGRERGEVEEAEIDRFLYFVRIVAGKQHPRNVRFNNSYAADQMRVTPRIGEGLGQPYSLSYHERRTQWTGFAVADRRMLGNGLARAR